LIINICIFETVEDGSKSSTTSRLRRGMALTPSSISSASIRPGRGMIFL
jgi:hypothetical protein